MDLMRTSALTHMHPDHYTHRYGSMSIGSNIGYLSNGSVDYSKANARDLPLPKTPTSKPSVNSIQSVRSQPTTPTVSSAFFSDACGSGLANTPSQRPITSEGQPR